MLLGRDAECERIERLVARARDGESGVLVLRGEPGIGKTALLEHAAASAGAATVLRVRGVESEVEVAFGGLHELLRPVLDERERLPPPQRAALERALGLVAGAGPEPQLVGAATLGLLAALAEERPVLVLADDVQWLDGASASALTFAARRLLADAVAVLLTVRAGEPSRIDAAGPRRAGADRDSRPSRRARCSTRTPPIPSPATPRAGCTRRPAATRSRSSSWPPRRRGCGPGRSATTSRSGTASSARWAGGSTASRRRPRGRCWPRRWPTATSSSRCSAPPARPAARWPGSRRPRRRSWSTWRRAGSRSATRWSAPWSWPGRPPPTAGRPTAPTRSRRSARERRALASRGGHARAGRGGRRRARGRRHRRRRARWVRGRGRRVRAGRRPQPGAGPAGGAAAAGRGRGVARRRRAARARAARRRGAPPGDGGGAVRGRPPARARAGAARADPARGLGAAGGGGHDRGGRPGAGRGDPGRGRLHRAPRPPCRRGDDQDGGAGRGARAAGRAARPLPRGDRAGRGATCSTAAPRRPTGWPRRPP